jgi:regulator of sigma E protease
VASISSFLSVVLPFLGVLTVVVFIHELGHFLVARWCGVGVQAFAIGFGPEIVGFTDSKGTRWKLCWLPLGGYVRFIDDETAASTSSAEALDKLDPEARKAAFQTQPLSSRALVVAAGPAFNVVSALLIYIATFWLVGTYGTAAVVDAVVPGGAAAKAGMRAGDRITEVEGRRIDWFADIQRVVSESVGKPLAIAFERDGRILRAEVVPQSMEVRDPLCNPIKIGVIGIRRDPRPVLGGVKPDGNLAKAGLADGDLITAIDGREVRYASEVRDALIGRTDGKMTFTAVRSARTITAEVPVTVREVRHDCRMQKAALFEATELGGREHWQHKSYGLFEAIGQGVGQTWYTASRIVASIPALPGAILKGLSLQPQGEIGGLISIARITAHAFEGGVASTLAWIAGFSIMLGIMNLLPIPVLDGGHLMFYAVEAVRGQPLDERNQELGFKIGLAVLMTMMIAALLNDIMGLRIG